MKTTERDEESWNLTQDELDILEAEKKYVKDWVAFEKYKKFKFSPPLRKNAVYETSDGLKIHLGMLPHQMDMKIEHLPNEEQELIRKKRALYRKFISLMSANKLKAFGTKIDTHRDFHNNLLEPRKAELIELFSKLFSLVEVHEIVCKEWKTPVTINALQGFRTKYIATITDGIEKHKREFSDVRLGVKRSRLEELSYLYSTTKDKYKKTPNRGDHEVLLKTLEAVRKEVEGDKLLIEGGLDINMDSTVSIHLQREVFKNVNINTIIIARMGARLGLPTQEVISRLLSSHYSKFSGIFSNPVDRMEQGDYPSIVPYDFDKIAGVVQQTKVNTDIKAGKEIIHNAEIIQTVVKSGIKEKLLAKLQEKQDMIKSKVIDSERGANLLFEQRLKKNLKKKNK